jgi:2-keto-4-pentenoate hydratase/2-oxohepta-3-ene-1,7-dioic acid hydratase in catechol pathway
LKLAHYVKNGKTTVCMAKNGLLFDVREASQRLALPIRKDLLTIDQFLSAGAIGSLQQVEEKITGTSYGVPGDNVKLLSPIQNPEKILLIAVNYRSHSREQNMEPPTAPYVFAKFKNALIGPGDPILIPKASRKVDWEVELAVIIGKAGKYIAKEDSMNYVAGYAIANDVSFRDFQYSTKLPDGKTSLGLNWMKGKGLDSSFPLGPWLVTKDEIPNPHELEISLSVNGKRKQRSNTSDMIFKIESLIEYISAGITLQPGDIISTGTPGGVAAATGGPFLKDGDIVEGSIDRIGTLRNQVRSESN